MSCEKTARYSETQPSFTSIHEATHSNVNTLTLHYGRVVLEKETMEILVNESSHAGIGQS